MLRDKCAINTRTLKQQRINTYKLSKNLYLIHSITFSCRNGKIVRHEYIRPMDLVLEYFINTKKFRRLDGIAISNFGGTYTNTCSYIHDDAFPMHEPNTPAISHYKMNNRYSMDIKQSACRRKK